MPKEIYDNPEAYPNTINLDKCLVLLPIHQDISENNCHYMIKKIELPALNYSIPGVQFLYNIVCHNNALYKSIYVE